MRLPSILSGAAVLALVFAAAPAMGAGPATRPTTLPAGEHLVADPPPISLNVQNATLQEVAAALSKATGTKISAYVRSVLSNSAPDARYTLNVDRQPFWEVFRQLSRQHGILPMSTNPTETIDMHLTAYPNRPDLKDMAGADGFVLDEPRVNIHVGTPANQVALYWAVFVDPRIPVVQAKLPNFTDVIDDRGNNLALAGASTRATVEGRERGSRASGSVWSITKQVLYPPNVGTRIVSIKEQATFEVVTQYKDLVVEDLEKHLNESFTTADGMVIVPQLAAGKLKLVRSAANGAAPLAVLLPYRVTVTDATGTELWSARLASEATGGTFEGPWTAPLKLVVQVPTKTKEITVPLKFKDIPLR